MAKKFEHDGRMNGRINRQMDGQKKWVDVWTDVYMDEQTIDIDILSLFYWSNKRSIMFFYPPRDISYALA